MKLLFWRKQVPTFMCSECGKQIDPDQHDWLRLMIVKDGAAWQYYAHYPACAKVMGTSGEITPESKSAATSTGIYSKTLWDKRHPITPLKNEVQPKSEAEERRWHSPATQPEDEAREVLKELATTQPHKRRPEQPGLDGEAAGYVFKNPEVAALTPKAPKATPKKKSNVAVAEHLPNPAKKQAKVESFADLF